MRKYWYGQAYGHEIHVTIEGRQHVVYVAVPNQAEAIGLAIKFLGGDPQQHRNVWTAKHYTKDAFNAALDYECNARYKTVTNLVLDK